MGATGNCTIGSTGARPISSSIRAKTSFPCHRRPAKRSKSPRGQTRPCKEKRRGGKREARRYARTARPGDARRALVTSLRAELVERAHQLLGDLGRLPPFDLPALEHEHELAVLQEADLRR